MGAAACGSDESSSEPSATAIPDSAATSATAAEPTTTDDTATAEPATTIDESSTTDAPTTTDAPSATDAATTTEPSTTTSAASTDATSGEPVLITEPTPQEMCPEGSWPRAAAYDIDTGAFQWASCTDQQAWLSVIHADDDAVYLWLPLVQPDLTVALDPRTGEELASAPPPPPLPFGDPTGAPTVIEVDGARITGGQSGPVRVQLEDGTSWTQPGVWAYGDVYAIGDGAVFAIEREPTTRLVGYEIETGDVRWAYEGDSGAEGLWPWAVADGRLYTLWYNLQVRSTADGRLIWATAYPVTAPDSQFLEPSPETPRMSGIAIGEDLVYVSFATTASGGD